MQNWLAPLEPDLYFGVPGGRPLPKAGADQGAIVFTQRLLQGEHVIIPSTGEQGVIVDSQDPSQPYKVKLLDAIASGHSSPALESPPASFRTSRQPSPTPAQQPIPMVDLSTDQSQSQLPQQKSSSLETFIVPHCLPTHEGLDVMPSDAPAQLEGAIDVAGMAAADEIIIELWPNEVRRVVSDEGRLAQGSPDGMRTLEACIRWSSRFAGKLCELPLRCVTPRGEVLLLPAPIRFWCPQDPSWLMFIVQASLRCSVTALSFSHINLAPWSALERHWIQEGGVVSPHHSPLIRTSVLEFTPHYGAKRKEKGKELPVLFARLVKDALGPPGSQRLVQSKDGTITQTCQCSNQNFDAARSVHTIGGDGSRIDTFTITIVRCANERAAGLRVGVCSEDGTEAWMLRLSDARLCDASGAPVQGAKPLLDNWPSMLPPSLMSYKVIVTVSMGRENSVFFCLEDAGGPKFEGYTGLPDVVRPCVHLTHKGDAVRLHDHTSVKIRKPGEEAKNRQGSPKPTARYMTWSPARYQRDPTLKHNFTTSLRTLRPSSPASSRASSPRSTSPRMRRPRTPSFAEVVSVKTTAGSMETREWTARSGESGHRCANCRQARTDGKSPWCLRCAPRARNNDDSMGAD